MNEKRVKDNMAKMGRVSDQKGSEKGELADKSISAAKPMQIELLQMDSIVPNPYQPRKIFKAQPLRELAGTIQERGLKQPIIVRLNDDKYQIVAGERRYRACQLLGWDKIPAIVLQIDDIGMEVDALLENIQREDLTLFEKAIAMAGLRESMGGTQEVANALGVSQRTVQRLLRFNDVLNEMPDILEIIKRDAETFDLATAQAFTDIADNIITIKKKDKREYDRILAKFGKKGVKIKKTIETLKEKFNNTDGEHKTHDFKYTETKERCVLNFTWSKGKVISPEVIKEAQDVYKKFIDTVIASGPHSADNKDLSGVKG